MYRGILENESMLQSLKKAYARKDPFPHIIFDHLLEEELLRDVARSYPDPNDGTWWEYKNVLERKLARNDLHNLAPPIRHLISELQSNRFVSFLEKITGIDGLIVDHTLNGGGLHQIIPGGHLDIHADYNYHPATGLDRRLNVIIYLNENWNPDWGGALELWDRDMKQCARSIYPEFNRLVVFDVNDWNYHGHPDPLLCPEGESRKSIALYYYSNGRPDHEVTPPHSVLFQKRPQDLETEEKSQLRELRKKGRL